jgi:broad specificity phosphatase PhoE
MRVTFLRHCRSIFNEKNDSEKDCDLSDFGKQQAAALAGEYDVIVCSVMKRARETLRLSRITAPEIHYTELCREHKQTICDFLEEENLVDKESEEQIVRRIQKFKGWLRSRWGPRDGSGGTEKRILVVTHADFVYFLNNFTKYLENGERVEIDI